MPGRTRDTVTQTVDATRFGVLLFTVQPPRLDFTVTFLSARLALASAVYTFSVVIVIALPMPPKKTGKDAKKLKQTTLFDGPMSPSKSPPKVKKSPQRSSARGRRPVPSRSQRDNTPSNSSSSDIGDIHFAPVEKDADEHDSNDDEVVPSPFKSTGKRRRIVRLASDSESEQSIVFISPKTKTKTVREDSEEADEPVTRKKRRLRRQTSDETKASGSDEDMGRLASEVDEESTPSFNLLESGFTQEILQAYWTQGFANATRDLISKRILTSLSVSLTWSDNFAIHPV